MLGQNAKMFVGNCRKGMVPRYVISRNRLRYYVIMIIAPTNCCYYRDLLIVYSLTSIETKKKRKKTRKQPRSIRHRKRKYFEEKIKKWSNTYINHRFNKITINLFESFFRKEKGKGILIYVKKKKWK